MNKYLEDFLTALEKVDIDYYRASALNREGNETKQTPENNFAAEVLRHWKNIAEREGMKSRYEGLRFNFDTVKSFRGISPDIVLHEGADNQNNQVVFVEVKTNPNSSLTEDLKKLKRSVSTELNFEFGVMLVANKPLSNTIKEIKLFIDESSISKSMQKKLFLLHAGIDEYNSDINIKYFSFDNLDNPIYE